jgi:hypothetical protein
VPDDKFDDRFNKEPGSNLSGSTTYSFELIDIQGRMPWYDYPDIMIMTYYGKKCKEAQKVTTGYMFYVDKKCPCSTCYRAKVSFGSIDIHAKFDRKNSWIKESMFKESNAEALRLLMRHESTHWAIAVTLSVEAGTKLRSKSKEGGLFCNEKWAEWEANNRVRWSLVNDINAALVAFGREEDEERIKFDRETEHGVDLDKEKEWEKKYGVQ